MVKWLIPPKIGKFRIYSEKILVLWIDNRSISAVMITKKSSSFLIENLWLKDFETTENSPKKLIYDKEKLKEAFEEIFNSFKGYDELWILVPSFLAVFKELTLPIADESKIKKILNFEIEPHLVFPAEEASSSFLLTERLVDNQCKILVASIRTPDLQKLATSLGSFNQSCHKLGVDSLVLLEMIKTIPEFQNSRDVFVMIEITKTNISLQFIEEQTIRSIRYTDFGLTDIIDHIQGKAHLEAADEIVNILTNDGLINSEENNLFQITFASFQSYFASLKVSIATFLLNSAFADKPAKIILVQNPEMTIKNLDLFLTDLFETSVENFPYEKWIDAAKINFKKQEFKNYFPFFLKPIGFAAQKEFEQFNLGEKTFVHADKKTLLKQILTAIMILTGIIIFVFIQGISSIKSLEKIALGKESEILETIKPLAPKEALNTKRLIIKNLLASTEESIKSKKNIQALSSCSAKVIPDILVALLEVTRLIDRTRFGVEIKNLTISQNTSDYIYKIVLEGIFDKNKSAVSVDDFTAFSRVVSLSRRFVVLDPILQQTETSDGKMGFALTLGVSGNENNK